MMKLFSFALILFLLLANILFAQNNLITNNYVLSAKPNWSEFYNQKKINGTFILTKLNSDTLYVHNVRRIDSAFLPASTFKIINSLISLETKVISDEKEIIKWDGKKRFYEMWNQDQNLRSGIKYSVVWFYQELARRVGFESMQKFVSESEYGNKKLGDKIDTFWLEGDIRISPKQQINFLENFLNNKLPFSERNYKITKDILLVDSTDNYKLFAKTGWTARTEKEIGWYIGFVEREGETWVFVNNIDIINSDDASERIGLTKEILKSEGILE